MPRIMSFSKTIPQMYAKTKTVTRRTGASWLKLEPYDRLWAVEKAQGLRKGDKVKRIGPIIVVNVRQERLQLITPEDVVKEGFPVMTPQQFIEMFCALNKCGPDIWVTRIEFIHGIHNGVLPE